VGVVAEAFGGLVAGEGDLCCEDGSGLVGPAVDEEAAELVGDLLRLRGVAVAQFRVLLDELEVAGVGLWVGGCLGAEGEEDRARKSSSAAWMMRCRAWRLLRSTRGRDRGGVMTASI